MQKITTHLWFDKEAPEAAAFYKSVFGSPGPVSASQLENTPSGTVDIVTVEIHGHHFTLLSAGPLFKFNPSISFLVACDTKEEVDVLWSRLSDGGTALMELGAYPFSERYAWIQDRYGLSWQLMFMGDRKAAQKITPTLMFTGANAGKAEDAIRFYASVFHDTGVDHVMRWESGEGPNRPGTVKHAGFTLEGVSFAAMDSAYEHGFMFNEAISFMVHCETQKEIDSYWEKLSADPNAEACGWLKDKYGVSWQVVPTAMERMLSSGDKERIGRVTQAFLQMKKFDLAKLEQAYRG